MFEFIKNLFSKKEISFCPPNYSEQELKQKIKILIIDDYKNELDKLLAKHGWTAQFIKDLDSYEQTELINANIVCVDINGVGAKLGCSGEGMELSQRIKALYPEKKIILYSSQQKHNIFSESLNHVDRRVYKNGDFFPFLGAVKELSEEIFNWENCVDYLYEKYHSSFNNKLTFDNFKAQIEQSISNKSIDANTVIKITGLIVDTASIVAKIISHCLIQGA